MSEQIICRVCSAPTNYAHLGINSCRSCAEFYKRTLTTGRIFACRQGNGQCTINPKDTRNCRGCRFEKCKQLGMKVKSVDSPPQLFEPSTSIQHKETLYARVAREYKASVERRKICELTLRPTSLHRHIKADIPGEDIMLCTYAFLIDVLKLYAGDYLQFASACFPEFADLTLEDQRLMLRSFASRLYMTEGQCGTFRKFGSYDGPYYMASLATCFDSRNFKFFFENKLLSTPAEECVKMTEYYCERAKSLLGPILSNSKFTEMEYAFLFALAIWQTDLDHGLPDHVVVLSNAVRRRLFEALKEYYKDVLQLDDYSVRLGNLITFEHTIQEGTNLLDEEMQAYSLAGLLNGDVPFLQMVMQLSL